MSLLLAVRRQYLTQKVAIPGDDGSKKPITKYLVMFRDGSGDFYLLDSVPPELQNATKRVAYFKKHKISPAATLTVEDGFLVATNGTQHPEVLDVAVQFLEDANQGLGVPYLLANNFVTEKMMVALTAAAISVSELGGDAAALAGADSRWSQVKAEHKKGARSHLGMTGMVTPQVLAPAAPAPAPVKQAISSKTVLISEARKLGIEATKAWTIEDLQVSIDKANDEIEAAKTVDVVSTTAE